MAEAFGDPQLIARRVVVEIEHAGIGLARSIANPMRMSETPVSYRLPPPVLGRTKSTPIGFWRSWAFRRKRFPKPERVEWSEPAKHPDGAVRAVCASNFVR